MFDAHIILRMNKRLKDPKDREKLESLKNDVFDLNVDVMEIFKRYNFKIIDNMSELKTLDNISYFRSRAYKINKHVQDHLVDVPNDYIEYRNMHNSKPYNFKYYVGQHIICRQPFKRKHAECYTNYMYEIVKYYAKGKYVFKIKSIYEDKLMKITSNQLKYMSLPHCFTCHSTQGLTIPRPYTIFDTNIAYSDRRWIYTAITRATYLDNITIYKHSKKECDAIECKYKQYFELKIKNYVSQDTLAGRIKEIKGELLFKGSKIEDYVDYDWIVDHSEFKCYMCGCMFDFEIEDGNVNSNF